MDEFSSLTEKELGYYNRRLEYVVEPVRQSHARRRRHRLPAWLPETIKVASAGTAVAASYRPIKSAAETMASK